MDEVKRGSSEKSTRLLFIDVAKLIGIILMVYCHSRGTAQEIVYIHGFHLPLFCILNGMTFRIKEGESSGDFLMRKIKGYLIPFIVLALLIVFCDMGFDGATGTEINYTYYFGKLTYILQNARPYPLWFVLGLFFSDILLYIFIRLSFKKDWLVLLYSIISMLCIYYFYKYIKSPKLVHSFDVGFVGVFFVCLGWLFYRNYFKKPRDFVLNRRWLSLLIGIALFALGALFTFIHLNQTGDLHDYFDMWGAKLEPGYIRFPAAVFCSFGTIFICNAIANPVMAYMGRHTLVILAFQQNLTIKLFQRYVAKGWYDQVKPFTDGKWECVWYCVR